MDTARIEDFWAETYFGCSVQQLNSPKDLVCPHKYLKGYHGVFIVKYHGKFCVSAPPELVPAFHSICNRGFDLFEKDVLQRCTKDRISCYIGPCWIGYLEDAFSVSANNTCLLRRQDPEWSEVFRYLQPACDAAEWDDSGIEATAEQIAAQYCDDRIVAAASYTRWGNTLAHIGVITHPGYRGRGFAANVVSLLTSAVKAEGLLPQYRTLCANAAAVKVAEKCGYRLWAEHIAVRLK